MKDKLIINSNKSNIDENHKNKINIQQYLSLSKLKFTPQLFLEAIEQRNISVLSEILKYIESSSESTKKLFINKINDHKQNALLLAASKGYYEIVESLLSLDFNLNHKDSLGLTITNYLNNTNIEKIIQAISTKNKISQEEAEILVENLNAFRKRVEKKEIANLLTNSCHNVIQKGRVPKYRHEQMRPYRSYSDEREIQLLRHVATQLHAGFQEYLKQKGMTDLKEIQIMHQTHANKHNLFIAINDYSTAEYFFNFIKNAKNLENILTKKYLPNTKEGRIRSERYAQKLSDRVFDTPIKSLLYNKNSRDKYQTEAIMDILKNGSMANLILYYEKNQLSDSSKSLIDYLLNNKNKMIYLVIPKGHQYKKRHAEEVLVDIAEQESSSKAYYAIAGKKRPCIGCSGRMQGIINSFPKNPGRFWENTLFYQTDSDTSKTIELLLTKPSHITLCKNNKTQALDYTSGSDSEPEEQSRPKIRKF